jgi:hypothetical protein
MCGRVREKVYDKVAKLILAFYTRLYILNMCTEPCGRDCG